MNLRRQAGIAVLLALCAMAASAQSASPDYLPETLGPWQRILVSQPDASTPEAGILEEYGSRSAMSARYESRGRHWDLTIHEMTDRVSAYGAYTFLRSPNRGVDLAQGGSRSGKRIVFYQGSYLALASADADLKSLGLAADHLRALPGRQMFLPALPEYLPRRGLISGTERFLLGPKALNQLLPLAGGDWAGFAYGAEAVFAEYRTSVGRARFLAISYPTPQITLDRMEEMAGLFRLNGVGDSRRPVVHLMREGTLLFLVPGSDADGPTAKGILEDNRYGREVAWSEPQEAMTDEEWLQTVGDLFIGTGLMMLVAMIGALAFALFRILAARLWPGRLFDRPENTEILGLRIEKGIGPTESP